MHVFALSLPAIGYAKEPIDTSVCAIAAHPSRFHNKTVRIRAAALSGMEAAILIDIGSNKCGSINLDFQSVERDETTNKFLKLFGAQITFAPCDFNNLSAGLAHILDPKAPAPTPCVNGFCIHCPRYNIVATFTGKLRYSGREPGHLRFGHLRMFDLQLDVSSVSNLYVTDTELASKP